MPDENGARTSGGAPIGKALTTAIILLPSVVAILIALLLILRAPLTFTSFSDTASLSSIAFVVLFLLAGIGAGYGVRLLVPMQLLMPPKPLPSSADDKADARAQIARWVVTAGTIGIFVTAMTLIIAVAAAGGPKDNWQERALSVFTSILPVFSTWVGTVLAFYFTNESFRQAQEANQPQAPDKDAEPITRAGTMIPYERVVRYEMSTAQVAGKDAKTASEAIKLDDIRKLMSPPGIARIIIFDDKRTPVYVVRHDAMPSEGSDPAARAGQTMKDYLDNGTNRVAAGNFAWTASSATIVDARRLLETRRVTDLFVTDHGRNDEPTLGWVPDDNLKKP